MKYNVEITWDVSYHRTLQIEADSGEEAREEAEDQMYYGDACEESDDSNFVSREVTNIEEVS